MQVSKLNSMKSNIAFSPQSKNKLPDSFTSFLSPLREKTHSKVGLDIKVQTQRSRGNNTFTNATPRSPLLPSTRVAVNKTIQENSGFKLGNIVDVNEGKKSKLSKLKESSLRIIKEINIKNIKLPIFEEKVPHIFHQKSDKFQRKESQEKLGFISQKKKSEQKKNKMQITESTSTMKKSFTMEIKGRKQNFKEIKFIDEGTFGKVYLVFHTQTNMIFSLKIIDKELITDESLHQLVREITIQNHISHPNIVQLYSFSADQTSIYLLLEPCLEGNLFLKGKKQPLQEKVVRKYVKQIGSALEYLHKKDIIHRDIKPENILLHENTAKICDFGWAVHSPLLRNTRCGTPLYTCPEMVKEEAYCSKIDIWCLGVLTYEMLFSDVPFEIRNLRDFCKIVENEINFPKKIVVSQEAKDFMEKCLEKDSSKRLRIRQVLEHPFLQQQK